MKKLLSLVLVGIMMLSSMSVFAISEVDSTEMTKNSSNRQNVLIIDWPDGYEVTIVCEPVAINNEVFVPLKEFMVMTDYKMISENDKSVKVSNGKREIVITAHSKNAYVEGKQIVLDNEIYEENNLIYINIEDLEKLFSYEVSYDSKNNNVVLKVTDDTPKAIKTIIPPVAVHINGTLTELTNKPFVENGAIYLPLRELFEKANLLSSEDTYINWDNGKIEILAHETVPSGEVADSNIKTLAYNYGLEIGKFEYVLNPGYEAMYQSKWGASNKKEMVNAPVLKDSKTYIPAEYVEYLINRSMQYTKIEIINAE